MRHRVSLLFFPAALLLLSACGVSESEVAPLTVPASGSGITVAPPPTDPRLQEGGLGGAGSPDVSSSAQNAGFDISPECSKYLAPVLSYYKLSEEKRAQPEQLDELFKILGSVDEHCSAAEYADFLELVRTEIGN